VTVSPVYFAYVGEQQVGPLTRTDLETRASRGEIREEDLVWETGTLGWVKAGEIIDYDLIRYAGRSLTGELRLDRSGVSSPPSEPRSGPAKTIGAIFSDLRSLSLSELVPISRLLDPETLGMPASWVLLVFGLGPLFLGTVLEDPGIRVRLFNAGTGALWLAFFIAAFRNGRHSIRLGLAAFLSTSLLGVLLISVLQGLPPMSWLHAWLGSGISFVPMLAGFTFGVSLPQELGKAAILAVLLRSFGHVKEPEDGMFHGLMAGLGFGIYEAVIYGEWVSPRNAGHMLPEAGALTLSLYAAFVANVVRMVSLSLLHAVWTAIAGYFIGLSFVAQKKPAAILLIGFSVPILLHGLYSTFLASGLGFFAFLVATLSLLLFLSYRQNAGRILAEIRKPVTPG
jgi:RsiW-degrading membrane proteinase PrsW (M82 family)